MNIQKVLEQIGYKKKEAELYLAALTLGESTIAELAAKLKIPRTSAQVIAEKLHKQGLMNYYEKRFHKYWVAENPEKFIAKLHSEEVTLMSIMPQMKSMRKGAEIEKPSIKMYAGAKEIRFMLEDIILTKNNIRGIVAWRDLLSIFGEGYVEDFIERQGKNFLKLRLICPENETVCRLKEKDRKQFRETRFLTERISLNTATIIYGNKVGIIALNPTFPTGFLIEDKDVAHTMGLFFEELWSHSS